MNKKELENELLEQALLLGKGAEREAALLGKVEALEKKLMTSFNEGWNTALEKAAKMCDTDSWIQSDIKEKILDLKQGGEGK